MLDMNAQHERETAMRERGEHRAKAAIRKALGPGPGGRDTGRCAAGPPGRAAPRRRHPCVHAVTKRGAGTRQLRY